MEPGVVKHCERGGCDSVVHAESHVRSVRGSNAIRGKGINASMKAWWTVWKAPERISKIGLKI
jgi:hypothetical protein